MGSSLFVFEFRRESEVGWCETISTAHRPRRVGVEHNHLIRPLPDAQKYKEFDKEPTMADK